MTPKEKAEDLLSKFTWHPLTKENKLRAKQCALLCVEELRKLADEDSYNFNRNYFAEVKIHLQKL